MPPHDPPLAPASQFPLNTVGRIVAGDDAGCHVRITPDDGHYVIYLARTPDMADAFDGWMYDMQDVAWYFAQSGWQVQWQS